jgi:hypothetical protein
MMTSQKTRTFGQESRLPRRRRHTCAYVPAVRSSILPMTHIERDSDSPDASYHAPYRAPFSQQSSYPPAISQQIAQFNPHRLSWAT